MILTVIQTLMIELKRTYPDYYISIDVDNALYAIDKYNSSIKTIYWLSIGEDVTYYDKFDDLQKYILYKINEKRDITPDSVINNGGFYVES